LTGRDDLPACVFTHLGIQVVIGHSPDQVLQADDAHQLVLADDRRAGDLSSPQQLEQVGHVVVRTYFE